MCSDRAREIPARFVRTHFCDTHSAPHLVETSQSSQPLQNDFRKQLDDLFCARTSCCCRWSQNDFRPRCPNRSGKIPPIDPVGPARRRDRAAHFVKRSRTVSGGCSAQRLAVEQRPEGASKRISCAVAEGMLIRFERVPQLARGGRRRGGSLQKGGIVRDRRHLRAAARHRPEAFPQPARPGDCLAQAFPVGVHALKRRAEQSCPALGFGGLSGFEGQQFFGLVQVLDEGLRICRRRCAR